MNVDEMIKKYDDRADELNKTGFLKKEDWAALCRVIVKYNCVKIMEFGTGTSTRLFRDCGVNCVSYEQDSKMLAKIKNDCPGSDIRLWDGVKVQKAKYDLIFVDGPWCIPKTVFRDRSRSFMLAKQLNPTFVAMHDMHFKSERSLRNSIFSTWKIVDKSELTHIVRNPKVA